MKKQLQCLLERVWELTEFQTREVSDSALAVLAAGAIEERDLDTSVAFALNYSTTVEGVMAISTGEGPGRVLSQSMVS